MSTQRNKTRVSLVERKEVKDGKEEESFIEGELSISEYWRLAYEALSQKKAMKAIRYVNNMITVSQMERDFKNLENCYKFQGDLYFRIKEIRNAIHCYQVQKALCEQNKNYFNKMMVYKQIACCYKLVKQYHLSLINYKKLLQLAWAENNTEWELKSYDFIGLAYYYLGELEKAKYYHKRMWEGICESQHSTVRELSLKALMAKRQRRNNADDRTKHVRLPRFKTDHFSYFLGLSDDDETELPSPRTGSGAGDQKFLPFYKPVEKRKEITRKNTMHKSVSNRIRPFMLISHLSPIESASNYFYVEEVNPIRPRDMNN